MFPLGTVLLPGEGLPLHVFEPRYRALVRHCLREAAQGRAPEFGVVLIERGSEVGGDDLRTRVGTMAVIDEVGELPDGRFVLSTHGARRIVVDEWYDDAPFPSADVTDWPDREQSSHDGWVRDRIDDLVRRVRRAAALAVELGDRAALAPDGPPEDPTAASFWLAASAPIGPLDRHQLLCADGVDERLDVLSTILDGVDEQLAFRLGP